MRSGPNAVRHQSRNQVQGHARAQQGSDAGIRGTLFHVDDHAATHAGGFGQLIECPSAGLALLFHPGADGQGQNAGAFIQ